LGIAFKEDEDGHERALDIMETSEPAEIPVFFEESHVESTESIVSPEFSPDIEKPPFESISEEAPPEEKDFILPVSEDVESGSRDFSSDFELAEPEPLITEPEEMETEYSEEPEETIDEDHMKEETSDFIIDSVSLDEDQPTSEDAEPPSTIPRFSWDDLDETLIASLTPSDSDTATTEPEPPPSAKVRVWSPYDEPTVSEPIAPLEPDSLVEKIDDEVEESESEISTSPIEEPPAPPPPPESDESEEERKRKARRLFFGT
jgi:hypothetical protein